MKQVLLLSDQPEITSSVCESLENFNYLLATASAQFWSLANVADLKPDIILWDATSKGDCGFSIALRSHSFLYAIPLICITENSTYAERIRLLRAGADLVVDSTFMPEELLAMIVALIDQSLRLHRHSAATKSRLVPTMTTSSEGFPVVLTACEAPILKRVARGQHNKEIAAALGVSRRTVESHITNMLNKTGLSNRTQLARWAMEHHDVHPVISAPNPFFRA